MYMQEFAGRCVLCCKLAYTNHRKLEQIICINSSQYFIPDSLHHTFFVSAHVKHSKMLISIIHGGRDSTMSTIMKNIWGINEPGSH